MSAIFKNIHELDKRIEAHAEHFAFKHPYLSFFALFIGMPICVLPAVFFSQSLLRFLLPSSSDGCKGLNIILICCKFC